mmetsp:Transcript_135180/g.432064  ORF Transcript_135180/g.432064 Transcript_135180/m.432064 type:complete len:309 (-) Transcript_135180:3151-4077(-)
MQRRNVPVIISLRRSEKCLSETNEHLPDGVLATCAAGARHHSPDDLLTSAGARPRKILRYLFCNAAGLAVCAAEEDVRHQMQHGLCSKNLLGLAATLSNCSGHEVHLLFRGTTCSAWPPCQCCDRAGRHLFWPRLLGFAPGCANLWAKERVGNVLEHFPNLVLLLARQLPHMGNSRRHCNDIRIAGSLHVATQLCEHLPSDRLRCPGRSKGFWWRNHTLLGAALRCDWNDSLLCCTVRLQLLLRKESMVALNHQFLQWCLFQLPREIWRCTDANDNAAGMQGNCHAGEFLVPEPQATERTQDTSPEIV